MFTLNPDSSVPLYQQLCNLLTDQIHKGILKPGDKIPSELQLSEMYGISRITVRSAITQMVDEGLLMKRHGKGTYVTIPVFAESKAGGSFTRSCQKNNIIPHTEVISVKTVPCSSEVSSSLQVEEGMTVHRICRVRYANHTPVIFEVDYFRQEDDFILNADFKEMPMSEIILKETGLNPQLFEDIFDIAPASKEHAQFLSCNAGTPMLRVRQIVMTENHQILYYNEQYMLTDRYKYAVSYS